MFRRFFSSASRVIKGARQIGADFITVSLSVSPLLLPSHFTQIRLHNHTRLHTQTHSSILITSRSGTQ